MATEAVAGFSSGKTTTENLFHNEAPSICADSSISAGTLLMKPENKNTENGREQVINIITGVNLVFGMFIRLKVCAIGTITICDGMIKPEIKK